MQKQDIATREAPIAKRPAQDFTEQLIEPFTQLRSEVDRLFESFPFRFPTLASFSRFNFATLAPAVEMKETAKRYKLTAELPGIDPDDVEVAFENGMLRIAGEKKDEREENESGYRYAERSYGTFERLISLPAAADSNKIDAKFKNGVLTITIAKLPEDKAKPRRIQVGKAA
jgi:HSP20 family protein